LLGGERSNGMTNESRTASEIADMIKARATSSLGPWPRDLQLFIFGDRPDWRCGLSPAMQESDVEYREGVLGIAKELQRTVKLAR
jgi:hypothetical protein